MDRIITFLNSHAHTLAPTICVHGEHDGTLGRSPTKYKRQHVFAKTACTQHIKSISQTYHSTQTNTTVDICITFSERTVWWKHAHWKARAPRFTLYKSCIKKIHKTYRFLVDMTRVTSNVKGFKIKLQNLFLFPPEITHWTYRRQYVTSVITLRGTGFTLYFFTFVADDVLGPHRLKWRLEMHLYLRGPSIIITFSLDSRQQALELARRIR